jgi:hypothetical protein
MRTEPCATCAQSRGCHQQVGHPPSTLSLSLSLSLSVYLTCAATVDVAATNCDGLILPEFTIVCHTMCSRSSMPFTPLGIKRKSPAGGLPTAFCVLLNTAWSDAVPPRHRQRAVGKGCLEQGNPRLRTRGLLRIGLTYSDAKWRIVTVGISGGR